MHSGARMLPNMLLDAGETGCGELTLLIFQAIKSLAPGQVLEVHAYDLAATMDIPAWCRSTGHTLVSVDADAHPKRFLIRKANGS
jgi:tRNA 2-thiouridine synthesizing protein A